MPLTVRGVKFDLSARCGNMVGASDLDGTPTSRVWDVPLAMSLRRLGIDPDTADPDTGQTLVTDADLAAVGPGRKDEVLDVAEFFALELALNNNTKVDIQGANLATRLSQIRYSQEVTLQRRMKYLSAKYGLDRSGPSFGSIDLGPVPGWVPQRWPGWWPGRSGGVEP